jgi:hypothetical protein
MPFCFAKQSKMKSFVSDFRTVPTSFGEILYNFPTKYMPCKPKVTVFTPKNYNKTTQRYKVFYLTQDSRIFEKEGFKSALFRDFNKLSFDNIIEDIIIIDIEFENEICQNEKNDMRDKFAKFLIYELIGFVDTNYRTVAYPEGRITAADSLYIPNKLSAMFDMFAVLVSGNAAGADFDTEKINSRHKIWITADEIFTGNNLSRQSKNAVKMYYLLAGNDYNKNFALFLPKDDKRNPVVQNMLLYFLAKEPQVKVKRFSSYILPEKIKADDDYKQVIFGAAVEFKNGLQTDFVSINAKTKPDVFENYDGIYYLEPGFGGGKVKFYGSYNGKKFSEKIKVTK